MNSVKEIHYRKAHYFLQIPSNQISSLKLAMTTVAPPFNATDNRFNEYPGGRGWSPQSNYFIKN